MILTHKSKPLKQVFNNEIVIRQRETLSCCYDTYLTGCHGLKYQGSKYDSFLKNLCDLFQI